MKKVIDIYNRINKFAPFKFAEKWDNCGILVGNKNNDVKKVLISLDVTKQVVCEAIDKDVDLIISHHPVIFNALKSIDDDSIFGMLIKNNISVISAHTNLDMTKGGVNDTLAEKLGLKIIKNPVEISYTFVESNNEKRIVGYGCIGELDREYSAKDFAKKIKNALGNTVVRYNKTGKKIKKVAVGCGSGGSIFDKVVSEGVDAFVTGDVKHDKFIDANNLGVTIFDAGHFHTENVILEKLKKYLELNIKTVEFSVADRNKDILNYEFD